MKSSILLILILFGIGVEPALAQNNLLDVANLNELPNDMPKVKHWASLMLSKGYIGDLQYSSSKIGDNQFLSFRLKGGKVAYGLPVTNGVAMHFKQKGNINNPRLAGTGVLSMNFKRLMKVYHPLAMSEFKRGDDYFYFKLGTEIFKLTDAQVLAHTLNYFVDGNTAQKFELMRKTVNAKMKSNLMPLRSKDEFNEFAEGFKNVFKDRVREVVFKSYVKGKDQKETDKNLQKFFALMGYPLDGRVSSSLEELNDPFFELKTETSEELVIPYQLLKMDPVKGDMLFKFNYQYVTGRFYLANKELKLTYKGNNQLPVALANLKQITYSHPEGKVQWVKPYNRQKPEVIFKQIVLSIAEDKIQLMGVDHEDMTFLISSINWPPNFLKTTLMDWKD